MARTTQLGLPLVLPSQAQKHVTVNEALVRIDAATQLSVRSAAEQTPPASPAEGDIYIIASGSSGVWSSRAGEIAIWSNGGWVFLTPGQGWRAWNKATASALFYDGTAWQSGAISVSQGGASTRNVIIEFDHVVTAGATNLTGTSIPAGTQVIGISGRVLESIRGATAWRAGVTGADNRYASGLGIAKGAYLSGMSGAPVTYYENTALCLTAEGAPFSGGRVRLAIHGVQITPPRALA